MLGGRKLLPLSCLQVCNLPSIKIINEDAANKNPVVTLTRPRPTTPPNPTTAILEASAHKDWADERRAAETQARLERLESYRQPFRLNGKVYMGYDAIGAPGVEVSVEAAEAARRYKVKMESSLDPEAEEFCMGKGKRNGKED